MHNVRMLIDAKNVSKQYGRGVGGTMVLEGLSLTVYRGDFIAIVGPSGSGKTTLAHVLGGLITPSKGTVHLASQPAKLSDSRLSQYRNEKVGFVFQNFSLIPYFTACENVALPLVVAGISPKERQQRAETLLKEVGLEERASTRADSLSGGERQRVAIARALIMEPEIIIADEPTGSLDSARGNEIIAILKQLHKSKGMTILMVTHDVSIARQADRIVHILDGKVTKEVLSAHS